MAVQCVSGDAVSRSAARRGEAEASRIGRHVAASNRRATQQTTDGRPEHKGRPVAQLARAPVSKTGCRGFESLQACQPGYPREARVGCGTRRLRPRMNETSSERAHRWRGPRRSVSSSKKCRVESTKVSWPTRERAARLDHRRDHRGASGLGLRGGRGLRPPTRGEAAVPLGRWPGAARAMSADRGGAGGGFRESGRHMSKKWYVVHTYSGHEDKVRRILRARPSRPAALVEQFGEVLVAKEESRRDEGTGSARRPSARPFPPT